MKFSVTTSAVSIEPLRERDAVGMAEVERDPPLAEVRRVPERRHLVEARLLLGRIVALKRRPSGRCTDSTLITSAPIEHSQAVENGPDQNAVKSTTRNPANGRSPTSTPPRPPLEPRSSGPSAAIPVPKWRGGDSTRSGTAEKRNGARGRIQDSPGWVTNTPRTLGWSNSGSSAPLPTTAAGTRAAAHTSTTSAAVCCIVNACSASWTSSARMNRPRNVRSSSSAHRSSRPIAFSRASHCGIVTVVIPT